MAPLYPYFFDVEGFPDVRVVGITPEQQAKNLKALKRMLRLSSDSRRTGSGHSAYLAR